MPATLTLACPCCGHPMRAGSTRKSKPYFVCDPCGAQLFIRRREGIERLEQRHGAGRADPFAGWEEWPGDGGSRR